jgi:hypothetical protein
MNCKCEILNIVMVIRLKWEYIIATDILQSFKMFIKNISIAGADKMSHLIIWLNGVMRHIVNMCYNTCNRNIYLL